MYGVGGIAAIKGSRDCSIEYEDQILGVGGGKKGKKWLKRIPTTNIFLTPKIAMLSDFLVLVEHNKCKTGG